MQRIDATMILYEHVFARLYPHSPACVSVQEHAPVVHSSPDRPNTCASLALTSSNDAS